ncbi:hypothetical protein KPL70_011799 [Citrus sinensis]|nr:hypothetical protein KPL70_011799 [Citrus sinensis]
MSKANTVIPKPIQWKDVHLPEKWILEGAAPPAIPKQLELNTELLNVTQYSDGKVKLSFRRSTSSRFSDKESCSSIPSLEKKFTKVPSVINLPYQPVKSQPRFSTSDIPSSFIRYVDYATSVPHPIYTSSQHEQRQDEKKPSPSTSPTFSAVTENVINVIKKDFELDKNLLHNDFYSEKSNPITIRKKIPEWKLSDSDRTVESEHPPLRSLTVDHGEPPVQIRASPYKIPKPKDSDANLTVSTVSPVPSKSNSDKKLKEPIFKPFQVSKTSQKLVQESKSDFAKAIREQLDRIEAASSSSSKSPPDLAIDNRPSALNQSRFNASSVYEWNIDGMSEYNILGLLQQMTMAANAYKTQLGTSDKAITGQLKGWWDHLLTKQQQLDILNAIQIDENGAPILDEFNNPIQDAVATLILTISLHFIGDPSHLRDKNAELLHNLRCRKFSEFQDYKTTFFTRLFLRDDANHITWKEKFLAGLPTLLGEKVRNSIKALYDNRIPYDELTYGELVSFVNKEGLKICQDLKLQKRLKWELKKSKKELDPKAIESHSINLENLLIRNHGGLTRSSTSLRKKEFKPKHKAPFNYKEAIRHKYGIKCHTAKYCRINRKLHELGLDEEILSKVAPLLIESSDSESSMSGDSDPLQMNMELEQHCKAEISDLESKGLIVKSRSPWSCPAFYVNKNSEIERGTPRLSGFWQIQIHPKDRYKTAFIVLFGQYEWTVMPFDDVLIFSQTIDQHFKHLKTFNFATRKAGLAISSSKVYLFQTKIRLIGIRSALKLLRSSEATRPDLNPQLYFFSSPFIPSEHHFWDPDLIWLCIDLDTTPRTFDKT